MVRTRSWMALPISSDMDMWKLLSIVYSLYQVPHLFDCIFHDTECYFSDHVVRHLRLVTDRETGKPKGYGFCEYKDEETALSARRNLQGYEINGRQLRVDFAENDKNADKNREQVDSLCIYLFVWVNRLIMFCNLIVKSNVLETEHAVPLFNFSTVVLSCRGVVVLVLARLVIKIFNVVLFHYFYMRMGS